MVFEMIVSEVHGKAIKCPVVRVSSVFRTVSPFTDNPVVKGRTGKGKVNQDLPKTRPKSPELSGVL
jgi:hypothetical protein